MERTARHGSSSSIKDLFSYSRHRRQQWAVLLKKIWNIDALKCPKCGGRWKWEDPRPSPEPLEMVCEPNAEYVPWSDNVPEIEVG